MTPERLLQLVLDYTNTNDYDDGADGWLSTQVEDGVFTVEFVQDSDEGKQTWVASWEMRLLEPATELSAPADGRCGFGCDSQVAAMQCPVHGDPAAAVKDTQG